MISSKTFGVVCRWGGDLGSLRNRDNVGTQAYVVEPEEWQAGFVGRYRRDFQSAVCDPQPFTPTVRVEASLR